MGMGLVMTSMARMGIHFPTTLTNGQTLTAMDTVATRMRFQMMRANGMTLTAMDMETIHMGLKVTGFPTIQLDGKTATGTA